eukprot:1159098-Pelagomonas_calceolata.AAC.3
MKESKRTQHACAPNLKARRLPVLSGSGYSSAPNQHPYRSASAEDNAGFCKAVIKNHCTVRLQVLAMYLNQQAGMSRPLS